MMKIMISAVGGSVAISYIQHLQKLGHYVIGIDMNDDIPGKHFCDEFHKVDPCHPGYINDIDYDLFFPFIDEELLLCMNDGRIIQCNYETNMTCINKHFLYQYCITHDIKVPTLSSVMDKYGFVRGIYSRGSKEAFLTTDFRQYMLNGKYIVQKFIQGIEYTIDCLVNSNGEFIFCVPRKRVNFTNVSLQGEIDMRQDLIDFTKDIVSKIKFKGPINIQVIVRDNEIYLIEINPRLAGSAIFSIMAGFDIIKDSIDIWSGNYYKSDYNIKDKKKVYRYLTEWSD
ncbi:hypothetical protein A2Z67_05725 [Candidatus Woesebacteria bacterium RBG_13_36_22]|uniref:ATP-grasp domain-containing protein n=1 Tax=Candidatus Woesebacteria bacterium RBG_13_36_22 TaxID=1802478 RepID=A0A1F7X1G2_9BACT|nr:MAG: hypothetical protein A2Z67_05725 [Candidatus Woesebacteria bacterium RBG_13_36_22]